MRKTNLKVASDRGWTPVHRGNVYCSPRCGGGCTWAAHQKAVRDADALAHRIGDGWEPDVWENMGWHWRIKKGFATIYGPGPTKQYSAWLQIREPESDKQLQGQVCIIEYADTPEDALGIATQKMRTFAAQIVGHLNALSD